MKLFVCTLMAVLASVCAQQRPASGRPFRELSYEATDKQAYVTGAPASAVYATASPALYKISAQSFGAPKAAAGPAIQALSYTPQTLSYNPQTLNYIPQSAPIKYAPAPAPAAAHAAAPLPTHVTYGLGAQNVQQHIQYAAQPVTYSQPQPVARVSAAAPTLQKYAADPQLAAALNFSPASEVSSFRFSSPLVTYSNLGVLTQVTGKSATAAANAAAAPHAAPVAAAPQFAYSAAPQRISAHAAAPATQQISYSAAPQYSYSAAAAAAAAAAPAPQKIAYSALPQQFAYSAAPQQLAYSAAPQKIAYAAQPAPAPAARIAYAPAPQQYVPSPSQVAYSAQPVAYSAAAAAAAAAPQQLAYSIGGQGAHSAAQPTYSVAPQYQYSLPSASKYASAAQ